MRPAGGRRLVYGDAPAQQAGVRGPGDCAGPTPRSGREPVQRRGLPVHPDRLWLSAGGPAGCTPPWNRPPTEPRKPWPRPSSSRWKASRPSDPVCVTRARSGVRCSSPLKSGTPISADPWLPVLPTRPDSSHSISVTTRVVPQSGKRGSDKGDSEIGDLHEQRIGNGGPCWIRTSDTRIKSPVLYQLS